MMDRPAYRIIDANANRAREALRVMEEFSRFVLDSGTLTQRTADLRHRFSRQLAQLDYELLFDELFNDMKMKLERR